MLEFIKRCWSKIKTGITISSVCFIAEQFFIYVGVGCALSLMFEPNSKGLAFFMFVFCYLSATFLHEDK